MSIRLNHKVGDRIDEGGQYRVRDMIKSGGMGTVYKVVNTFSETPYAVKECDVLDDPRGKGLSRADAVEIFRRESRGLENLNHAAIPNGFSLVVPQKDLRICLSCGNPVLLDHCDICKLSPDNLYYQPALVSARYYLFMEFIEGQDLDKMIVDWPRPLSLEHSDKVFAWSREVADILSFLHQRNLAHCDVKPENLRVRNDGRLFLLDFGLLRLEPGAATPVGKATRLMKATGTLKLGTEGYAPPEQVDGRPGAPADIYALGMTTLQLLSGLHPSNPLEVKDLKEKDPAELVPGLKPEPARFLARAVHPNPEYRPSANEWSERLQGILLGKQKRTTGPVSHAPKPSLPRPPMKAVVAALVALLLVTFFATRGPDPDKVKQGVAQTGSAVYNHIDGEVTTRLNGGEQLELVDSGADAYWFRVLKIDGKSSRGYISRDGVMIRRQNLSSEPGQ